MTQDSQRSPSNSTQSTSTTGGGAKEARRKANERLGQWIRRKYRLESCLGVGGMATVYAARHRNGSRTALKILHAEFAREEGVKTRFLREGYVANKVDHPGVVRIIDDDETDQGEPFLVMELLEGLTLQQLWKKRKRKVAPAEALPICAEVLDCLVPFHEQSIIHRDIKPANIFITEDGRIKLLDFGVAQLREAGEALTRAGTALGTPSFMSPEQAMGKSDQLDGRSDVFALGATLYAILGGKRLHHGKSDNEAFILAATQPAPSLARLAPELPVEVIALVDRALQWDRRKRFRTAAEFRDACLALAAHFPNVDLGAISVMPGRGSEPHPEATPRSFTDPQRPSAPTVGASPAARPDAPATNIGMQPSKPTVPLHGQVAPQGAPLQAQAQAQARAQAQQQQGPLGQPTPHSGISSRPAHLPPQPSKIPAMKPPPIARRPPPTAKAPVAMPRSQAPTPQSRLPVGDTPARSQPASQAPRTSTEGDVARGDHPLAGLFERFEKSLPPLRHYGLGHPEGVARIRAIHGAIIDALREVATISFQVHPFCFSDGPTTLWEPGAPWDQVPYGMASSGVEELIITPGVTEEEVYAFMKATVVDPQLGLTEGDIAAAMWEAGLEHITCKTRDDVADADARDQVRFFAESEEVEADIQEELAKVVGLMAQVGAVNMRAEDRAEAAAMALTTDTESFKAAQMATEALRLDAASAQAIASQLDHNEEEWRDRFYDVAANALTDAVSREDIEILWREVQRFSATMVNAGHWTHLLDTHDRLKHRVEQYLRTAAADPYGGTLDPDDLTRHLFHWDVIHAGLLRLSGPQTEHDGEERDRIQQSITEALPLVAGNMVPGFMALISSLRPELQDLVVGYIERHVDQHQQLVIDKLDALDPALAQRMLAVVAQSLGDGAQSMLKPLLMNPNPALRCEATALLSSNPEVLGKQLVRLLSSADPRLRLSALTTMVRYSVKQAGPGLVGVIEAEGFSERPDSEKRKMFESLYALHPARAEKLLEGILKQHGMLADDRLDRIRILAAETLGENAESSELLECLRDASKARPWNTRALRSAATHAIDQIEGRLISREQEAQT